MTNPLRELLRRCRADSADREDALAMARILLDEDQALFAQCLEPIILTAMRAEMRYLDVATRANLAQSPGKPRGTEGLEALAKDILGWPLLGGLPLGEARRDDLTASIDWYARLVREHGWRHTWLVAIASKLPSGRKKVRDVMSADVLNKMMTEAQNG